MEISPAAKVGMISVLALVILALIYTSISPYRRVEGVKYYATFDRIEGLSVGAAVRLAGVPVGKVTDIQINEQKRIVVEITVTYTQNGKALVLSSTSQYGITGNLLGDRWFEITPHAGPTLPANGQVVGVAPATVDTLMNKGELALGALESSVKNFNRLVGDPEFKRNVQETVANFNALSGDMRVAAGNANRVLNNLNGRMNQITGHIDELVTGLHDDLRDIGGNFRVVSQAMRRTALRSEPEVRTMVANLREMSASLRSAMATVRKLASNPQLQANLLGTVASLRASSEEILGAAKDIHGITSDPQLKEDLDATVHDARETMEGAKAVVKQVRKAVGGFTGGDDGFHLFGVRTEMEYDTNTAHLFPNAALTLLPDYRYSALVGVDSIGYKNLVNAQIGVGDPGMRFRGGVVRSKVGVGFDNLLFHRLGVSTDVYDTHNVKVDVVGRLEVDRGYYVMGGVLQVFRGPNTTPVVGVGKRF